MEETDLECDLCKLSFHYEKLSHFSGYIDGEFSNHIHVCSDCFNKYNLASKLIEVNLKD